MCSCEWNYTCTRCGGTPWDYRYFLEDDPAEVEEDRRERAALDVLPEVGITRPGR